VGYHHIYAEILKRLRLVL